MDIIKFVNLTETNGGPKFSGQYPGGAGGASVDVRGGSTGKMKEFTTAQRHPAVSAETDKERLDELKQVLRDALYLLPKYGLVTPDSVQWKEFEKETKIKLSLPAFRPETVEAIEEGLKYWIAPLKELSNKKDEYTGARDFMATVLRGNKMLSRQPLVIINSINSTGNLFPSKVRMPVQAGEPLSRKGHEAKVATGEHGNPLGDSEYSVGKRSLANVTVNNIINLVGKKKFLEMLKNKPQLTPEEEKIKNDIITKLMAGKQGK